MPFDLVAIDLETSGLNPQQDAIIEIGAVRLREGSLTETFSTLVNPEIAIDESVTQITGIRQEDLRHAPTLSQVLPELNTFVGDAVLLAHNAPFDMAFLHKAQLFKSNRVFDTLELASLLLPSIMRYGLGNLAAMFNISLENAHRALDDAQATAMLYDKLWQKACALPKQLLKELATLGENNGWELWHFFAAAAQVSSNTDTARMLPYDDPADTVQDVATSLPTLDEIFAPNGSLAAAFSHYETRPQQVQMAQHITSCFERGTHAMIEAGTGVGKSLAYLIPAAHWAITQGERVVIATNTLNLQDQLINKDVPLAAAALGTPFRAALLKGKSNYLCPRRLNAMRQRIIMSLDELRLLAKLLIWLQENNSGCRSDITLRGLENALWSRFSADDEGCQTHNCLAQGNCPLQKARQQAANAHVIIVNHALLISDIQANNYVLPHYDYLIVDEAHNFEEAVTNGMSVRLEHIALQRALRDYGTPQHGVLTDLVRHLQSHLSEKQQERLLPFVQDVYSVTSAAQRVLRQFFSELQAYGVSEHNLNSSNSALRLTEKVRRSKGFMSVITLYNTLADYLQTLVDATEQLVAFVGRIKLDKNDALNSALSLLNSTHTFLAQALTHLRACVHTPEPNQITWLDYHDNLDYLALQVAPLNVGQLVKTTLWDSKKSVILTSATLRTDNNYRFVSERLALEGVETYTLDSPFDYKNAAMLYIPKDVPDPNAHKANYQRAVERAIVELATVLKGRVLVLFTSYAQLRETAQAITPRLALGNITVHDQSFGANRDALLESFKTSKQAVLLGTKSFWQGVDIAGNDLLGLVIVRLPFTVPNDPIFAARAETYNDAFETYAVPEAVLRFRQGFGRLIRTQRDKGIVVVLDSRITNKGYGKNFIDALPDCTVKYSSVNQLAQEAQAWLGDILAAEEEQT